MQYSASRPFLRPLNGRAPFLTPTRRVPPLTDSQLPCFTLYGEQTAQHLRERFQLGLTQQAVDDHLERLIVNSIGSHWTRLYDSVSAPALAGPRLPPQEAEC